MPSLPDLLTCINHPPRKRGFLFQGRLEVQIGNPLFDSSSFIKKVIRITE
jgi:hypothetical protein